MGLDLPASYAIPEREWLTCSWSANCRLSRTAAFLAPTIIIHESNRYRDAPVSATFSARNKCGNAIRGLHPPMQLPLLPAGRSPCGFPAPVWSPHLPWDRPRGMRCRGKSVPSILQMPCNCPGAVRSPKQSGPFLFSVPFPSANRQWKQRSKRFYAGGGSPVVFTGLYETLPAKTHACTARRQNWRYWKNMRPAYAVRRSVFIPQDRTT